MTEEAKPARPTDADFIFEFVQAQPAADRLAALAKMKPEYRDWCRDLSPVGIWKLKHSTPAEIAAHLSGERPIAIVPPLDGMEPPKRTALDALPPDERRQAEQFLAEVRESGQRPLGPAESAALIAARDFHDPRPIPTPKGRATRADNPPTGYKPPKP